jgi:hypothetical protein
MAGPLPFAYADIEAYCNLKGIYLLGERERLLRLLDPLDREWMQKAYEENGRGSTAPPPPPPNHSPPRDRGNRQRTKQV